MPYRFACFLAPKCHSTLSFFFMPYRFARFPRILLSLSLVHGSAIKPVSGMLSSPAPDCETQEALTSPSQYKNLFWKLGASLSNFLFGNKSDSTICRSPSKCLHRRRILHWGTFSQEKQPEAAHAFPRRNNLPNVIVFVIVLLSFWAVRRARKKSVLDFWNRLLISVVQDRIM